MIPKTDRTQIAFDTLWAIAERMVAEKKGLCEVVLSTYKEGGKHIVETFRPAQN